LAVLLAHAVGYDSAVNKNLLTLFSWSEHHRRYEARASSRYYCTVISQPFGSAAILYVIRSTFSLLSLSQCSRLSVLHLHVQLRFILDKKLFFHNVNGKLYSKFGELVYNIIMIIV